MNDLVYVCFGSHVFILYIFSLYRIDKFLFENLHFMILISFNILENDFHRFSLELWKTPPLLHMLLIELEFKICKRKIFSNYFSVLSKMQIFSSSFSWRWIKSIKLCWYNSHKEEPDCDMDENRLVVGWSSNQNWLSFLLRTTEMVGGPPTWKHSSSEEKIN